LPGSSGRRDGSVYTVVYALYRREEMSHEEFVAYWRDVHAPIVRDMPGLCGFETIAVVAPEDMLGEPIDGFAKLSFESREAFERAEESDVFAAGVEDTAKFVRHLGHFELDAHTVI
jgi:uncharacterized protein (TIGR02118 family)